MIKYFENLAKAMFGVKFHELGDQEQKVIESIANKEPLPENINLLFHEKLTFGQKMADKVASFGGSWTFIILFAILMLIWIAINSWLVLADQAFDPYPYILLNLALSTLAAMQAPIIMMSQNRQAAKDRFEIAANYEISLKTDIEMTRLHQKIDDLTQLLKTQEPIEKN
ncbi:DUF1003 domain-containing protein [Bermanella sp. WJH001]|uniref:DUF1003 domain-containing protein n=1 Tax=Bermanella sp. WJH001 TaxID=3048005 RepID=UPI0024BF0039|nr:DUF1003 domain-containing protein [Bermanella sp. WJH001]MDJ1537613.1 DUF1003 domain-containing protein [Bermanella sp. WJH001]